MAFQEALAEGSTRSISTVRWFGPAVLSVVMLAATVPILLTAVPPVMDFPNHLARIWLIAGGIHEPPLSEIYEIRWWQASTNLAVDFVGAMLVRIAGLAIAAKILLAMMLLGPPLGAAALNRSLFGRWSLWQISGVLLAWSTTAVEGFLSFQIGLAVGLFAAVAVRPLLESLSLRSLAIIALTAAALLLVHPFAILMFLSALAGLVLGERLRFERDWLGRRAVRVLLLTLACAVPIIALFLLAPHPPGAYNNADKFVHWNSISETLSLKNLALLYGSPFLSYRVLWDLVAAAPFVALVAWAAIVRALRFHAGLLLVAAALTAIAVFLPTNLGDGAALPIRFPMMAALLFVASITVEFRTKGAQVAFAAVLIAVVVFRIGSIAWTWHVRAADVEQLQAAAQDIPSGAAVMVMQQKWDDNAPLGRLVAGCPTIVCASERHFGSLVVIWRRAFVPVLFTVPGQHPLGVRPPWSEKAVHASGIPFADELEPEPERDRYLPGWWQKFDYVLLLNADLGQTLIPHTELVRDTGFAKVYRVIPDSP